MKRIVDREEAWGLWRDGWALLADDVGDEMFPLWPAREFAEACATGRWLGYLAEAIPLSSLMGDLMPKLISKGIRVGVFPTPERQTVVTTNDEFIRSLTAEMAKYE